MNNSVRLFSTHLLIATLLASSSSFAMRRAARETPEEAGPSSRRVSDVPSITHVNTAYANIKNQLFLPLVDGSQGRITWRDWDLFKPHVFAALSHPELDLNERWNHLGTAFTQALVTSSQTSITQTDWEIFAQTHTTDGNPLLNILRALDPAAELTILSCGTRTLQPASPLSSASTSDFADAASPFIVPAFKLEPTDVTKLKGRLLLDYNAIQGAIQRDEVGIIPYLGDYKKHEMKHNIALGYNPLGSNEMGFLTNYFTSDPSLGLEFQLKISYNNKTYAFSTVEAAYQAGKRLISGDITSDAEIDAYTRATAEESKGFGDGSRKLNLRYTFKKSDLSLLNDLMLSLVSQKFLNHLPLGLKLIDQTGDHVIIEGNSWKDKFWGMPFDGSTLSPGENKLGQMLMYARDVLRGCMISGLTPLVPDAIIRQGFIDRGTIETQSIPQSMPVLPPPLSPASVQPSALPNDFNAKQYLINYPDLVAAFGQPHDPQAQDQATQHYLNHVVNGAEERDYHPHPKTPNLPSDFNPGQYLRNYPDLERAVKGMSDTDAYDWATKHYLSNGMNEGRVYTTLTSKG